MGSVDYKWSGKFKLEILAKVQCSIDRHFQLSETFTSCICDGSVVLSCIRYLFIPISSSSAYSCSQRRGIIRQSIVRNFRCPSIERTSFNRLSTLFLFADCQVQLTTELDKARNHKIHRLLAFCFVFTQQSSYRSPVQCVDRLCDFFFSEMTSRFLSHLIYNVVSDDNTYEHYSGKRAL